MIKDEILQMIEEVKPIPVLVGENTDLYADLGFDSLSFILLLLKIEDIYSITFAITEMEMCLEVGQLIALVEKKVRGRQQGHD